MKLGLKDGVLQQQQVILGQDTRCWQLTVHDDRVTTVFLNGTGTEGGTAALLWNLKLLLHPQITPISGALARTCVRGTQAQSTVSHGVMTNIRWWTGVFGNKNQIRQSRVTKKYLLLIPVCHLLIFVTAPWEIVVFKSPPPDGIEHSSQSCPSVPQSVHCFQYRFPRRRPLHPLQLAVQLLMSHMPHAWVYPFLSFILAN